MAVVGGKATFIAKSTTASAADFGQRIGVRASRSWEIGDPARPPGKTHGHASWSLDRDLEVEGESLDAGLLKLLSVFDGREADLEELSADYEMYVLCYASCDSTQGGFVLGSTVMRRMGQLGLDLVCTIYLDEDEPPEQQ